MTFQQLQYILDIRKTGSFSKTAQKFYISQASISQAVSALEQEIGSEIFQRNWNGVVPTEQGAAILKEVDIICDHHRRLLGGYSSNVRRIRISFDPYAPLDRAFGRLYQECRGDESVLISLRAFESSQMVNALLLQEVDVCIAAILEPFAPSFCRNCRQQGLDCRIAATLPTAIILSPAHPLYHKPELSVRDFRKETLIDRGELANNPAPRMLLELDTRRAILVESPDLQRMLLERGYGYTISYQLDKDSKNRHIPLDMRYALVTMTNPQHPMQPEVKRFLELAQEEAVRADAQWHPAATHDREAPI